MIYFISLGSNEEPRIWFLKKAIEFISEISQIEKISSIYESEAWGFSGYPFLNICMKINTDLPPKSLLNFFKRIETILGRKISKDPLFPGYSDRPIDIDIIFWEKGVYEDEEIIIPHPLAHKRKFILIPLTEIEENLIHPIFSKSILELLEEIDDDTWVIKLKNL
jgi:2-amino-4-hydroxy-6-hydroxymethyldihydropteridine diphosphokinase